MDELPKRNDMDIHMLNTLEPSTSMCGIPDPIRAITEQEALDPDGRHFTCGMCHRAYAGLDRFGDDE